jgi:hypothetical protein
MYNIGRSFFSYNVEELPKSFCLCWNNVNYQIRHSVFGLPQHLSCSTLLASLPSLPILRRTVQHVNRPHKCTMVKPTACLSPTIRNDYTQPKPLYSPEGAVNTVPSVAGEVKEGDPSESHTIFSAIIYRVESHAPAEFTSAWKTFQSSVPSGLVKNLLSN